MNMRRAKLNGAYILVATLFLIYSLCSYGAQQTIYNIKLDDKAIGGVQITTTKVCGEKIKLEGGNKPTDEQEEKSKSTEKIISELDLVTEDLIKSQKWHWEEGERAISLLTDKDKTVSCVEHLYYFNHALEHLGQMLNLQVQGVEAEEITVTTSGMTTPQWSCFKLVTIEADGDYPVYIELSRGLWKGNGIHKPEVVWDEGKCIKTGGEGKEKYVADPILRFAMNAFKKETSELREPLYCVDWSAKEHFEIATCPIFEGSERRKTAENISLGIYQDLVIVSNAKMRRGSGSTSSRQAALSFSKDMELCEVTYHIGSAPETRKLKYENISGGGSINLKILAREKKTHSRVPTSGGLQPRMSIPEPPASLPPPSPPSPEKETTGCSCTIL